MSSKSLGTLTLDLIARTGGFVKGMSKAERASQKWRRQVQRDLKKMRGGFNKFAKAAAASGLAAAGAFTILTKEGLQFIDSQAKMAARLGTTVDDLRGLQIAASDFGIEQGKLASGLASYTKRLGDAARGTGEAQKAYEALGLEAKDLVNLPLPEQLALIAERISEVDSAAERASIADRLMSGGRGMVNLFEEGGNAIREAANEVEELGLSLDAIDTKSVENANDAMSRISLSTEGLRNQIVVNLAPALQTVSELFIDAAKESRGFADTGDDIAAKVVSSVGFVVDSVEGLKRTFEVTGAGIAVFALQSQLTMMKLGESIIDYPINAVNDLIEGLNKISPIDIEPVAISQLSKDLDSQIALLEGAIEVGKKDIQDILMEPMPTTVFNLAYEEHKRLQEGREAGLGMDGGVNNPAIAASVAVADALDKVTEATEEDTESTEDHTEKTRNAAEAVKDFGDTASSGARAIQDAISGLPTGQADPRYGFDPDEGTSSSRARARFEASANRIGDPNVINLGGNDSAIPTWSRDFLDPAAGISERVSASFSSVQPRGIAEMQKTNQSMTSAAADAKDRGKVTIQVVGDNGTTSGEVEGNDNFIRNLADALSGVAAGSR